jgi:predicted helicase
MKETVLLKDKFKPRDYQYEAIDKVLEGFNKSDRGKIIMPCGTGKSWTYLWIEEAMKVKRIVVFVPSLTLIRQIKNDWIDQCSKPFEYLCVCSDNDVDNNEDGTIEDIGGNVSSNPEEIKNFLIKNFENDIVIFSTYHSSERIVESIKDISYKFDLIICDEAHRTAGIDNTWGMVHNDFPSVRRLYGTATPRVMGKRKKDDDRIIYEMNDIKIFGPTFYNMTFKEAIYRGIICDYKLIVVGVTDINVKKMVDDGIDLSNAINRYALQYCLEKYKLKKVISFHKNIKSAEIFTNTLNECGTTSYHINGKMSGSEKELILNNFKDTDSVITNARCLTEGVNIPTVDAIFFANKRNSITDITQATGRALRKSPGKEIGYIIVPLYNIQIENINDSINGSQFKFLIDTVQSICFTDQDLQSEINQAVRSESNEKRLEIKQNDKIVFDNIHIDLTDKIFDHIIDGVGNYRKTFLENVEDYKNGIDKIMNKSNWRVQFRKDKLSEDKIKILKELDTDIFSDILKKPKKTFNEIIEDYKKGINKPVIESAWRTKFKRNEMSKEKIKIIENLIPDIFTKEKKRKSFNEKLEDYKNDINRKQIRGAWRMQFKQGILSDDKINILKELEEDFFKDVDLRSLRYSADIPLIK